MVDEEAKVFNFFSQGTCWPETQRGGGRRRPERGPRTNRAWDFEGDEDRPRSARRLLTALIAFWREDRVSKRLLGTPWAHNAISSAYMEMLTSQGSSAGMQDGNCERTRLNRNGLSLLP